MSRQTVEAPSPSPIKPTKSNDPRTWLIMTLLFSFTYLLCTLAVVPIFKTQEPIPGHSRISQALVTIGNLLPIPTNLHILQNSNGSQKATGFIEFLLVLLVTFAIYAIYALYLKKQEDHLLHTHRNAILFVIGITMIIAAYIYIFTPATLSEDIYLYADYGRIILIHHANPYFVPPIHFSHDPILQFVHWKTVLAIYGPVWMLVCAFLAFFAGTAPLKVFIVFRIFVCIIHFINAFLIFSILRTRGCSTRTILIGTLLYALNPLILFESGLGGHNDILVAMFVLLGILFAFQADKKEKPSVIHYIPALIALTLAVLVKFTIIPIVVLFIVMLFFKASASLKIKELSTSKRWLSALFTALVASATCLAVAILFYGPFWIGHSTKAILYIFSSQPPATHSLSSLLSIVEFWSTSHRLPAILVTLGKIHTWNIITYGGMLLVMILACIHLYRAPTTQNVILGTLGTIAIFLLTTNWFTPWYVIWLVTLTAIYISVNDNPGILLMRIKWALVAFTFTFSFSAFMIYNFFAGYQYHRSPRHPAWLMLSYFITFSLPALAFLIFFIRRPRSSQHQ